MLILKLLMDYNCGIYGTLKIEALESEKRSILLRIIVPDNEESRDQIIFATRKINQTKYSKATLRVTDPIHLQIEMYFKK